MLFTDAFHLMEVGRSNASLLSFYFRIAPSIGPILTSRIVTVGHIQCDLYRVGQALLSAAGCSYLYLSVTRAGCGNMKYIYMREARNRAFFIGEIAVRRLNKSVDLLTD